MLYICEKPSQAKDIGKVLGVTGGGNGFMEKNEVRITWCYGHLLNLVPPDYYDEKYKSWSEIPVIPSKFIKTTSKETARQYKVIKELIKKETEVVIATDSDREGEMIAREILEKEGYKGKIKRLWLHALDEASIKKGLSELLDGNKTLSMYYSAYARQIADWLVGMNYTRLYSSYGNVNSIGRVQTPTLKFVVDRDLEIENFKSKIYFELEGLFNKTIDFKALLDKENRIYDMKVVEAIKEKLSKADKGIVKDSKKEEKKTLPPKLFSLSSLQKFINNKYGYSASEVLDIAQALYETYKFTTYPRTDCEYLPASQLKEAEIILKNAPFKVDYPANKVYQFDDSKISAHHAIIPTLIKPALDKLKEKEKNVFLEIYKRYVSMFYPPLITYITSLKIDVSGELFKAQGTQVKNLGWKVFYQNEVQRSSSEKEEKEPNQIPYIEKGASVTLKELNILEKKTLPPARFTDSTILEAMKNAGKFIEDKAQKAILKDTQGLGTEATRANIIETLIKREYLRRDKKLLISTEKGRKIISLVADNLKSPVTTAKWEEKLKLIEEKKLSYEEFTGEIKKFVSEDILNLKQTIKKEGGEKMEKEYLEGVECPLCGGKVVINPKGVNCEKRTWDRESKTASGCAFSIYEKPYNRTTSLKKAEYLSLLKGNKVPGKFVSKAGKNYEASIYLQGGDVKLEFSNKK
jgi:DNA topoisomerase-3